MAFSTRFGLRRRAFRALIAVVGLAALGVLAARGGALWLDGRIDRVSALLGAATGGEASIGQWRVEVRGINPVVHARKIEVSFGGSPALAIDRLDVELDLLESLARSYPVARGLVLQNASVALVADEGGVRLAGAAPRPAEDTLLRMLLDSDAVRVRGLDLSLEHMPSGARCKANLRLDTAGRGGRHRASLVLESEAGGLRLDADIAGPAMAWRSWRGDARLEFDVPPSTFCSGVRLSGRLADADWGGGRGVAELHFARGEVSTVLDLAARGQALRTRIDAPNLTLRSVWRNGRWRAAADLSELRLEGTALFQDPGRMDAQYDAGVWRVVAPPSQLATLARRLLALGVLSEARTRWLRALAPAADMGNTYVRIDSSGWVLSAPFAALSMHPYKGSPGVAGASGRVTFFPGGVEVDMEPTKAGLSFPDVFPAAPPPYDEIAGTLQMAFEPGWVAIIGRNLEARSRVGLVTGDFALWRPEDPLEQVLFVDITLHDGTPGAIRHYVPNGLSEQLQRWLRAAVVNEKGRIDGRLVYHGHLRQRPHFVGRQVALGATVQGIDLRYDPAWPIVHVGRGHLLVDRSGVTADAPRFAFGDGTFHDGTGRLPAGSDILRLHGIGQIDAKEAIALLQQTPVRPSIAFVNDGWEVRGPLVVEFDGRIPLPGAQVDPVVHVDADVLGAAVHNPALFVAVDDLRGTASYDYPAVFNAEELTATFLDRPAIVRVDSDEAVRIHFESIADVKSIERWSGPGLIDAASGEIGYRATVAIPLDDEPVAITVDSDLVGVSIDLPEPIGKVASASRPSRVTMSFPEEDVSMLAYDYGSDVHGISEFRDGRMSRGGVVLAGAEPELPQAPEIVVSGSVHRASMDDWLSATESLGGAQVEALPPLHLDGLQIDRLYAFDRVFEEMRLDALERAEGWQVEFTNPEFSGRALVPDAGPSTVDLDYAHLTADDTGGDGLEQIDFSEFEDLNLSVKDLEIGGEDYGSWRFDLRVSSDVLQLNRLVGQARGVQIGDVQRPASLVWSKAGGIERTAFGGIVRVPDVAAAQAAWGFEPSLVAEDMWANAALAWPGPPSEFAPNRLAGAMHVESGSGRFEQIQAGANALRVLGIFNFAALSRRARLDFSDVLGKGLSFDRIKAEMRFEDGMLELPEPALVEGTSSILRITGRVDLTTWALDNDVVLTLPVSRSLPWYAAYAALANPLAGAGVLVAERLLRDQLDSFSSARYRVTGTLDEPKLTFVKIFDTKPPSEARAGDGQSPGT